VHAKKRDRESKPANEINRTTRAPFASGVSEPAQHAWIGAWITHRVLAVERQWLWLVVNLRRSQLVGFMRETKMEKTAGKSVRNGTVESRGELVVYSIIVIYFSNTNSASASLDSAFHVRTGVENAHASVAPCIGLENS